MVVPFAFARRAQKRQQARAGSPDAKRRTRRRDGLLDATEGGGFAAAVLVIMFSEQAFLNAGPLITRGLQGAAAAGFIFNVLMIARAPLQLFQAVSTSILPHLTSLHTSDRRRAASANSTARCAWSCSAIAAFTALAGSPS